MHLIVKARELNLPGRKPLYKGDSFEIDDMAGKTLKLVGKAEDPPLELKPVGQVATTQAPPESVVEPVEVAEPVPDPTPDVEGAAEAAPEDPAAKPYRTRRLKAED